MNDATASLRNSIYLLIGTVGYVPPEQVTGVHFVKSG